MQMMKPIVMTNVIQDDDLLYEIKYDGFRAVLKWSSHDIRIVSRNNTDLTANFPEITSYCRSIQSKILSHLPIQLDGELVILNNNYQANFSLIQTRGRLKTEDSIEKVATKRPATFIVFDFLQLEGNSLLKEKLLKRKQMLNFLFQHIPVSAPLRLIETYDNYEEIGKLAFTYKAEGIIAKRKSSTYLVGKKA